MKLFIKTGFIVLGISLFALFFYAGLSLGQSTVGWAQFVTGVNKWEYAVKQQTAVYYSDNTEMGKIGYKKEYSPDFPEFMKQAVVSLEDRRFYQHNGLDSRGIGRAIVHNLMQGSKSEGGSTITQQLARTLFLGQEKTYTRKIKEVFIATAIEDKYDKDTILNMYLNEIYMGRGCSGMQCAANSYFGKNVMDLNKAEITILAGMIQAPEHYAPERNMEGLKSRQKTVIESLVEQEIISAQEGEEILAQNVSIKPYVPYSYQHPYYMAYLTAQLEDSVGAQKLYQGGLKIYTTIDPQMQKAAEKAVKNNIKNFSYRGIKAKDAALVSVDPNNGEIKAMVGGADYANNQLNMAVIARQPGSAIKPLYYCAAMNENLITSDTVLNNKKRDFNGYQPDNYGSNNPGKATVKEALVNSYNVASVEVLQLLGVDKAVSYMEKMGITSIDTESDMHLALALGGMKRGISPLQLASAYTIFTAGGVHHDYYTVKSVVDEHGNTLFTSKSNSNRVINSRTAEKMDEILKAVVRNGTGYKANIAIVSGGKTGTTTDSRDLWYVGYTSELVTSVWVGNSSGEPVSGYSSYGGSVAAPIWKDYMNTLLYNHVLKEAPYKSQVQSPPEGKEELPDETPNDDQTEGETEEISPEDSNLPPEGGSIEEPGADDNQGIPPATKPEEIPAPEEALPAPEDWGPPRQ